MTAKKQVLGILVVLVVLINATVGYGYIFDDAVIEYWSTDGSASPSNEAILVIDFNANKSFAFGYRWNGTAYNWDAVDAICDQNDPGKLHVDSGYHDIFGHYINDYSYPGATKRAGDGWSLYSSDNGKNWDSSWLGTDSLTLLDGGWHGWSYGSWVETPPGSQNWVHSPAPTTPITMLLPGDINNSNYIDDDDLSIMLTNWNTWEPGLAAGNIDGVGYIDDDDLSILLTNWNAGTPPGLTGQATPEPATLGILGMGALVGLYRKRSAR